MGSSESNTFLLLRCLAMRLFYLTIPKPLKQYTLFKKKIIHSLFEPEADVDGVSVFRGVLFRVTIRLEWLRYFDGLAVGETAAPACFLRENAEGAGMPPLLSY